MYLAKRDDRRVRILAHGDMCTHTLTQKAGPIFATVYTDNDCNPHIIVTDGKRGVEELKRQFGGVPIVRQFPDGRHEVVHGNIPLPLVVATAETFRTHIWPQIAAIS